MSAYRGHQIVPCAHMEISDRELVPVTVYIVGEHSLATPEFPCWQGRRYLQPAEAQREIDVCVELSEVRA